MIIHVEQLKCTDVLAAEVVSTVYIAGRP